MKFIDTHIHWYVEDFKEDLAAAIARAQAAGVKKFILPAVHKATHAPMMETAARFAGSCFPCIGLHPTEVNSHWREELDFIAQQLSGNATTFVGIGETGLDLHYGDTFIVEQKIVFEQQLRWAAAYNLPVVIHAREAFEEIFDVLEKVKPLPLRGVFHAYSGNMDVVERIKRYGDFKIGVGGVVTFKNAELARVVEKLDLCRIVLETDAPWLSPVPYRGQRNESSYIPLIAEKIAALKNCPLEEVAAITTANAEQLFNMAAINP
ncbi:MAG: TatD family hydrolase [Prevotellaceae bacterium]|nr:TatD family hydrolase [Prevotellaceae bacterium]